LTSQNKNVSETGLNILKPNRFVPELLLHILLLSSETFLLSPQGCRIMLWIHIQNLAMQSLEDSPFAQTQNILKKFGY